MILKMTFQKLGNTKENKFCPSSIKTKIIFMESTKKNLLKKKVSQRSLLSRKSEKKNKIFFLTYPQPKMTIGKDSPLNN